MFSCEATAGTTRVPLMPPVCEVPTLTVKKMNAATKLTVKARPLNTLILAAPPIQGLPFQLSATGSIHVMGVNYPELTFWLSPVESVPSFASNGAQFFLQSVSSAPNCPSRSPANPFSPLLEPDFSDTAPFAVFPGIDFLGASPQPAALSCGDRESRHPLHHCSKQSPG
jgi:hypothetical protein